MSWKECLSILRQNEKAAGASTGGNMGIKQSQEVLPHITFKLPILLNTHVRTTDCNLIWEILDVSQ